MSAPANRVSFIFIIPFVLIGLICTAIGAFYGWSAWRSSAEDQRTEGTVVGQMRVEGQGKGGHRQTTFAPLVDYQVDGKAHRIQGSISSSTLAYAVGDKVVVRYPASNPAEGRIDTFMENWLGPICFGGLGSLFTLIGLGMLVARLRSA